MKKVFIYHSNSEEDSKLCTVIKQQLSVPGLEVFLAHSQGHGDQNILITQQINEAHLILLGISVDLFATPEHNAIKDQILTHISNKDNVLFSPIILRPTNFDFHPEFASFREQTFPKEVSSIEVSENSNETTRKIAYELCIQLGLSIPDKLKRPAPKGDWLAHAIDRTKQKTKFERQFKTQNKLQFYSLFGEEADLPYSLVKRFRYEMRKKHFQKGLVYGLLDYETEFEDLEDNKYTYTEKLTNALNLNIAGDIKALDIAQTLKKRANLPAVVISHQITLLPWKENQGQEVFLKWLLHDFWCELVNRADIPHFILFLNFLMPPDKKTGFLGFGKSIREIIRDSLGLIFQQCTSPLIILPDLEKITASDIRKWSKTNGLYDDHAAEIEDLIDQIFGSDESKMASYQDIYGQVDKLVKKVKTS